MSTQNYEYSGSNNPDEVAWYAYKCKSSNSLLGFRVVRNSDQ